MYKDERSNQATKYLLFKKFKDLNHEYNKTDIEYTNTILYNFIIGIISK